MTFRFEELELDPRRQELRRAGEVVHVEPQVFDLLALLLHNHDRIVSKDEILDAIWQRRFVSEAALSSRINAARKAIGDNGNDQRFIRTFHKRGFRFVGDVIRVPDEETPAQGELAESAKARPEQQPMTPDRASSVAPAAAESSVRTGSPSIAVMPFANVGESADHDYFAYGLTEDVIRLLGRNRWLTVLTRHTAAGYQGSDVDPRSIGADLGVSYLVKGSVRRMGERVRITAELVDAREGQQLWSEAYDLELTDIFDIQEVMAQQIAAAIEPELAAVERQVAARKAPEKLDAWDCFQRGFWHLWGFTTPGFANAEAMFKKAIALEPGLARAHAGLSYVYFQQAFYDDLAHRPALIEAALNSAREAVSLDERDALCHCVLGRAYTLTRNYAEAIAALEKALALNPSFAQGYFALAFANVWSGREEEAVALIERAVELSPRDPHLWTFYNTRAFAHFSLTEFESAASFARRATRLPNATHWPFAMLAASLGQLGQTIEGKAVVRLLLDKRPDFSLSSAREDFFFCSNRSFIDRYEEGLRRSGVPA
jgi:TolB-like protein